MGRKRKSGDGTIRLRKDGRWEGRVVIGYDENGLPKTKNVLAKTKNECVEKLKTLKDNVTPPAPAKVKPETTFGDWMENWYQMYCRPAIRYNTQQSYEAAIRLYIDPKVGDIPLKKLTPQDLQQLFTWLKTDGRQAHKDTRGNGLPASNVHRCYELCHQALEKAAALKLIVTNPCDGCKLPRVPKKEMQILTREEMRKLLAETRGTIYYELLLVEFATGLRLGELMALQWDDLDMMTGVLRIDKQVIAEGSELKLVPPKTKTSIRTVILPPSLLSILKERRSKSTSRWLFPSPKIADRPISPNVVRRRLYDFLDRAGCKRVRFHDLRHTYATNALAYGMDVKTLSTILGHGSGKITLNTYSHTTDAMRKAAAEMIDQGIAKVEAMQVGDLSPA